MFGQRIQRLYIRRIQRYGLLQVGGEFSDVALAFFEQAEQKAYDAVLRREGLRLPEILRGERIFVPAHGEQPEIDPCSGFSRRQFRHP